MARELVYGVVNGSGDGEPEHRNRARDRSGWDQLNGSELQLHFLVRQRGSAKVTGVEQWALTETISYKRFYL